jgi:hypothetical protein
MKVVVEVEVASVVVAGMVRMVVQVWLFFVGIYPHKLYLPKCVYPTKQSFSKSYDFFQRRPFKHGQFLRVYTTLSFSCGAQEAQVKMEDRMSALLVEEHL